MVQTASKNDVSVRSRRHTVSRTVYFTEDTERRMEQVLNNRPREISMNDLIREAVQQFLEEQTDLIGSRRHFQKSMQERLDKSEERQTQKTVEVGLAIVFYQHVVIQLLAYGLAFLLARAGGEKVTPQALVEQAIISARKDQQPLDAQVQAVREIQPPV